MYLGKRDPDVGVPYYKLIEAMLAWCDEEEDMTVCEYRQYIGHMLFVATSLLPR